MDIHTFDRVYADCRARDMTHDDADYHAARLAHTKDTHVQTLAKALEQALAEIEAPGLIVNCRLADRCRAALAATAEAVNQPELQPDDGERDDVTLAVITRPLTDASTAYDMTLSQGGRTIYFALTESRFHMVGTVAHHFAKLIKAHTTAQVNGGVS